jgi:ribonuclease HI
MKGLKIILTSGISSITTKYRKSKRQFFTLPLNAIPCRFTIRRTIETSYLRQNDKPQTETTQYTTTEVILVADGYLIEGKGTWAAIMTDKRGVKIASRQGRGRHNNLNSYKVELEGCLGAILMTKTLSNLQSCTLYCDNKEVIHRINIITQRQPSAGWTEYDILLQIRKELPPNFKCFHVKGHQDNKVNPELQLEDNLNIMIDMCAKKRK